MKRTFLKLEGREGMLFDGNVAVCWQIVMTRSLTVPPRMRNITPGVLYTFIFEQDSAGGNTFAWPLGCENATPIDLKPNSYTVQNFIGRNGGILSANIPASYN
jgi:hypothetical protein